MSPTPISDVFYWYKSQGYTGTSLFMMALSHADAYPAGHPINRAISNHAAQRKSAAP